MHISLDSALGRQRRLNSVGESVLQIAPNAAAAYSLRSLTGGDPKVVRVRRDTDGGAGDNDEQDFTASEVSSGALAAFVGSGNDGFVETWYDQSGNSKDATQATANLQPKIVNAGSLLTDGIDFDGTSQAGLITGSFSLTQAFTTFSVSHTDDASSFQGIWSTAANTVTNINSTSFFGNNDGFAVTAGNILTTAGTIDYVADRTYLRTNVVNGGSSSIFVDGATGATGNAGSTNPSGILILGYFRSTSYFNLDGAIKELIIYDSDQTSNRAALETNIAAANGVTLS